MVIAPIVVVVISVGGVDLVMICIAGAFMIMVRRAIVITVKPEPESRRIVVLGTLVPAISIVVTDCSCSCGRGTDGEGSDAE
jgi:hypothetical protein